uniref:Uncharacterized protein n=1 Tax=Fundulus heteroclitus TaxID=8078 RepID=A0A146ZUK8_FUNHE
MFPPKVSTPVWFLIWTVFCTVLYGSTQALVPVPTPKTLLGTPDSLCSRNTEVTLVLPPDLHLPVHCPMCSFYTVTYRIGSTNTKPSTLSQQFSSSEEAQKHGTIFPIPCVIGSLSWDLERSIQQALIDEPDPGGGPPHPSGAVSSSGLTHPSSWVILVLVTQLPLSIDSSGGLCSIKMSWTFPLPVPYVLRTRTPMNLHLDFFSPYPCLADFGPT